MTRANLSDSPVRAQPGPGLRALQRTVAVLGAVLLPLLVLQPAAAQKRVATSDEIRGVLELFTSQGCSSCPQADAVLSRYADQDGILALSYHVDYWDYIGWKDALASRQNTDRQRAYGKAFGQRMVYTPQMIVNGEDEVIGSHEAKVARALSETHLPVEDAPARLTLDLDGDTLRVSATGGAQNPDSQGEAVLIFVTFRDETVTEVHRGENEGLSLVNRHSVRDWRMLGKVTDRAIEMEMPVSMLADPDGAATGCAVFLQRMDHKGQPGAILAAAMLPLKS